ncbi:MAG: hypothetical protein HY735_04280 [Verrucomicrobia bacterium]|nr:hypothetical protein [Verrucomicrobiota bacterium]
MKLPGEDFDWGLDGEDDELDRLEKAKSKMLMDFGLEQPKLERVTVEVLKQLIRDKPERMSQALRSWLHPEES